MRGAVMLAIANNDFITHNGIGMDAGDNISKILVNAKDLWSLVVLVLLGSTAIALKHGKQIFGDLFKPKTSAIDALVRRITVLEERDEECGRNMSAVQMQVAEAREEAATSKAHSESCSHENAKLKSRVKTLESLILKRHGVEETE